MGLVSLCIVIAKKLNNNLYMTTHEFIVKLREREGQRVDLGRSLKGHLWMVDGGIPFPDALH